MSLALGAAAIAGKELVSGVIKDAYGKLKELIKNRYPNVSLEQLAVLIHHRCRIAG
jgi:hypothetical protein